jgi:hypothetical protein
VAGGSGDANVLIGGGASHIGILNNTQVSSDGQYGISVTGSGSVTGLVVKGNTFGPNGPSIACLNQAVTVTGESFTDNVVDVCPEIPFAVTSAAALALPVHPTFVLNGGTGVTSISTATVAPYTWNFTVGSSTTFTAGSTIGNTITITKWGQIYWDGTKAWISGV